MPPAALISSTASCADCTTVGATTLFAPDSPTATPILIGSDACACTAPGCADAAVFDPMVLRSALPGLLSQVAAAAATATTMAMEPIQIKRRNVFMGPPKKKKPLTARRADEGLS